MSNKLKKAKQEWQRELTPEQFAVTRNKGTEPAFSGKYWDHHAKGQYRCVCCHQVLFQSDAKFDSGTGWPSFFEPKHPDRVIEVDDKSLGIMRTEVCCRSCDAHLGHVFSDGPAPTGLRYCINSAALDFDAEISNDR